MEMRSASPGRIIIPGLTSEEENSKKLAIQLLQTIERETYTNREILGACAVLVACTIKARYKVGEWQQTFVACVNMAKRVLDQF